MKSKGLFELGAAALGVALIVFPGGAFAASLSAGLDGNAGVSNDMAKVNIATGVETDGPGVTVGSSASGGVMTGNRGNEAPHPILSDEGATTSGTVTITSDDAMKAEVSDMDSASVATDDDFAAFAKGQMHGDADLKQVTTSSDSVVVEHAVPAHLFGFFPIAMTAKATVNADGSVSVAYPWYAFLASTSGNADFKSEIQSRVATTLATNGGLGTSTGARSALAATSSETAALAGGFTAAERAHVLADIEAAFSATASAGTN